MSNIHAYSTTCISSVAFIHNYRYLYYYCVQYYYTYYRGESAFSHMQSNLIYAKRPMINRLDGLPSSVPISMLLGTRSWFDTSTGKKVYSKRLNSFVDVHYIEDAGHHIHADCPEIFNQVVNEICEMVDDSKDIVSGTETRDEQTAFHTRGH